MTNNKWKMLLSYMSLYKVHYLFGTALVLLTNWILVLIPEYIQTSIDLLQVDIKNNQDQLSKTLIIMLVLAILVIFTRTFSRTLFFNPGRAIERRIKNDLLKKLIQLPQSYYAKNATGTIISRVHNDILDIRLLCGFGALQVFNLLSALSFTPYKMWQISPTITLYAIIPIVLCFGIVRFSLTFMMGAQRQRQTDLQKLSAYIVDGLAGVETIKEFNLQAWSKKQFHNHNEQLCRTSVRIAWFRSFAFPILENLGNILNVLVLGIGGYLVFRQELTIGEIIAMVSYAFLITMPMFGLGFLTTLIQRGRISLESIQTILNQPTKVHLEPKLSTAARADLFKDGIKIRDLHFGYNAEKNILNGISFDIPHQKIIGVLGGVGSGKTTLVNCLNKHLPCADGMVLAGEKNINQIENVDWRLSVRTISQLPFLFSDTVKNNILLAQQNPDLKVDWQKVLKESVLSEEVQHFPQQLETIVGEKGILLSGGQKQRINLARSKLEPCHLLILDNVFSAVDHYTEKLLLESILNFDLAKSLLIISHRTQIMEQADQILVLNEGKIVEQGTHQTLLSQKGYYYKTWKLQNQ